MTPDERQMLTGLFDRIRANANAPRDREAEMLIQQAVQQQPYSPYLLAQTVLVMEQQMQGAADRIKALEAQVADLQTRQSADNAPTSFLGGLGKSLFGSGSPAPAPRPAQSVPQYAQPQTPSGPWGSPGQAYAQQGYPQQGYAAPQPLGMPQRQGGGFLSGALSTAAGVAGGVMLAESLGGLFGGHHGGGSLFGNPAVAAPGINTFDADHTQDLLQDQLADADRTQDELQDANDYQASSAADYMSDSSSTDYSSDV